MKSSDCSFDPGKIRNAFGRESDNWLGDIGSSMDSAMTAHEIRCLGDQDEGALCRLMLSLEPLARCSRFGQAANDATLANHAKCALANADWIVGAFLEDRLQGVVEIYRGGPGDGAEAAFVVERESRRQGLGWALLRAAMKIAADAETKTLRMIFSRHNWGMRKLAVKAGGRLDVLLGEIVVDVALDEGADRPWDATAIR
jgi:ribosomal protein S18 acetylase RimI-like enzyme